MKVLCPACERLVTLTRFRVDGGALLVTCDRCGEETRVEPQSAPGSGLRAPGRLEETSTAGAEPGTGVESGSTPTVGSALPASAPPAVRATASSPGAAEAKPSLSLASSPDASNVVRLRTSTTAAVEAAATAADAGPFEVPAGLCPKCLAKRGEAPVCAQCGLDFGLVDAGGLAPSPWLQRAWVALLREWGDEKKHDELCSKALERNALVEVGRLYRLRLAHQPDDPLAERGRGEVLRLATLNANFSGGSNELAEQLRTVKRVGLVVVLVLSFFVTVLLVRALLAAPR